MTAGIALADAAVADLLRAALPRMRWFADKGARIDAVEVVDVAACGDDALLALVDVAPAARRYFVPLALDAADDDGLGRVQTGGAEVRLADAMRAGDLAQRLLDDVRHERTRPARRGRFRAYAAPGLRDLPTAQAPAIRRLSVEQSNTSVVLDDAIMFKAYRRVHAGPQAELEIARFLDAVGYANTPAYLGSIEYETDGAPPTALCMLQRFVRSRGDAWTTTLSHLAASGGADDAAFGESMRTLGRRTAELHRAFATPTGDAAFAPEDADAGDAAGWSAQAVGTAERAFATLERDREGLDAATRASADELLARRDEVIARCTIAPDDVRGTKKTRFHGDFHLGQVLDTGGDFLIVDFEGEPGREPAQRRRKASPVRDVAGMLRSFDYAAVTAERESAGDAVLLRAWRERTVDAFLAGYRAAIGDCASYPADPTHAQRLLDCFVLEKACYELSYELANRPRWVGIPLAGIRAILA